MKKLTLTIRSAFRLLTVLLLFLAATVPQAGATARVYVRCNGTGVDAGSSYLYVWGTSEAMGPWRGKKFSEMSSASINGYTYYYVDIDQTNINLIFNNSSGQTADISISNSGSYYITYNGGSSYNGPNSVADGTFYVVGDNTSIFPNAWNVGDATMMTYSNGTYSWTSSQVHLIENTDYAYKVRDHNGNTWYPSGDNAKLSVSQSGTYTVTITMSNGNVSYSANLIEADETAAYYVVGEDRSIFPNGWTAGDATLMTENNGTYSWTASNVHLTFNTSYAFKVTDGGNGWFPSDGNATFTVDKNGTYNVLFTFDGTTVNAVPTLVTEDQAYTYDIYVRYKGSEAIGNVYAYTFDTYGTKALGEWGGTRLTDMTPVTLNGYTYYHATVTSYDPAVKAILNENQSGSTQTADLTLQAGNNYFTYSGGATVSGPNAAADPAITYYAESSFAGWTTEGTQMTANGDGSYSKTFPGVSLVAGTTYEYKVYGNDGTSEGVWIGDNGENGTFSPSVTGTYDVTITLNSDGTISHTLVITGAVPIYIIGAPELGLSWNYAPEAPMTFDPATGYFTYTCEVENGGTYNFVFGNGQGIDWSDFDNNYRIGPNGTTDQSIMPNDEWNSTQLAAGSNKAYSITVNPGTVTFTFDPATMRFKVDGESLTHRYIFYVLPSDHQTVPYIYLWGLGTDEAYSNTYPGTQLTQTEVLADGNTWYVMNVELTADYIHALVNGGSDATKTADITHIDPGTYYIYWTTEREDGQSYNDYFLTNVAPTAPGGTLYMIGTYYYNKQQYHYDPNSGVQLKYDANSNVYYLNNVNFAVHNTFCFTTQLSTDWSNVGTRYGNSGDNDHVVGDNATNYFAIDEDWINKNIALDEWSDVNGEYRMLVPGIYNVLVNLEEKWVKLIKTDYYELSPMNVFLEQTPNVVMSEDGNNFIQDPGTEYSTAIFGDACWPLAAFNGTFGDGLWDPHDNGNKYPVTYVGDTITADGKAWWHWQVEASIAELFFTRLNKEPFQSDTIRRKAGVLWVTWDEVDGKSSMTDHSREYFEAAANALPTNAVVMEGHYYVYFINTVDWDQVYCYAWDNIEKEDGSIDHTFLDGYSRRMDQWPGQPCELVGIDPVTGYEVWRYDFGTIIGTDIPNGGILFNDGNEYAETEAKEQTGDFEYVNGAVYDYLGMVDGAYTLNNLIRSAAKEVRYTVSNDLLGIYYDKDAVTRIEYKDAHDQIVHEDIVGALYAKDLNLYGEKSVMPDSTYTDYVYDICASDHTAGRSQIMIKKTTYDQSNWVKLVISPNYDNRQAVVAKEDRPDLSKYVNRIIPAGSLDVFMTDTVNPTAHVLSIKMGDAMAYEPNVYISSHFNDTVVFNFTHQDWLGEDAEYKPNYSCQPKIEWFYNEDGSVSYGEATRSPNLSKPYYMFYVAPKPQEIAYVTWVVYDNYNEDGVWPGYVHGQYTAVTGGGGPDRPEDPGRFHAPRNWNRTIYLDAEAYPNLAHVTEGSELEKILGAWSPEYGPYSNGYMQYGGVKVNWSLFDEEASGGPWWQIIKPGQAYKFKAIVRYARGSGFTDKEGDVDDTADNYYYAPGNGYIPNNAGMNDSISVRNAPRRAVSEDSGFANMYFTDYKFFDRSKFIIFPIEASSSNSNGNDMGNVTTVKEVNTSRSVVATRYYNLMGVESDKPFEGVNIVVTFYNDGSRSSRKILRR